MTTLNRRSLLQLAAAAGAASLMPHAVRAAAGKRLRLGMCVSVGQDPEPAIARVHAIGLPTCMVGVGAARPEVARPLKSALDRHGVVATAVETLGPGPMVWDFRRGPSTLGLVPRPTRRARIDALKAASDLARSVGIPAVQSHCGFFPENPADPLYDETLKAIEEIAKHCKANGQWFLCETGQETPVTMLRVITDLGLDNVGAGLDTANLILCGTGNPVDAVEVLGKHVRSVHAKDGLFPTDATHFGREVPIGQGKVDFRRVLEKLAACGYQGAITIERETSGSQQVEDVKKAKVYLERLMDEAGA